MEELSAPARKEIMEVSEARASRKVVEVEVEHPRSVLMLSVPMAAAAARVAQVHQIQSLALRLLTQAAAAVTTTKVPAPLLSERGGRVEEVREHTVE